MSEVEQQNNENEKIGEGEKLPKPDDVGVKDALNTLDEGQNSINENKEIIVKLLQENGFKQLHEYNTLTYEKKTDQGNFYFVINSTDIAKVQFLVQYPSDTLIQKLYLEPTGKDNFYRDGETKMKSGYDYSNTRVKDKNPKKTTAYMNISGILSKINEKDVKAGADDFKKGLENQKTERINLPEDTEFFKSPEGKIIAYGSYGEGIFISEDGKTFYELKGNGFGGSSEEHNVSFENPHNQTTGGFNRKGNELTLNGQTYKKTGSLQSIDAVRLPEVRKEEYSFTLKSGEKLRVTADKYNYSYESFKLFIGDREVPIKNVTRYRDGGTTYIETEEGTLFVPFTFDGSKKPTWKGEEIER